MLPSEKEVVFPFVGTYPCFIFRMAREIGHLAPQIATTQVLERRLPAALQFPELLEECRKPGAENTRRSLPQEAAHAQIQI